MPEPITAPEWIGTVFPEDVQKDPTVAPLFTPDEKGNPPDLFKYKTVGDFLKGVQEKNVMLGKKGVIVPDDKSTPEQIEEFYKGVLPGEKSRPEQVAAFRRVSGTELPAKPEEYKFSEIKDIHPSLKITPESQKAFAEAMHKAGVPQKYADVFNQFAVQQLSTMLREGEKASKAKQDTDLAALKTEWGVKFEDNLKGAQTLVEKVLGKDVAAELGNLTDSPVGLKFLAKLSTVISPDAVSRIAVGSKENIPDQEAAQKEIQAIIEDAKGPRQHPMNNEKHADYKKWQGVEGEWTKLNRRASTKAA